jgi:hypothetical protein
MGILKVIIALVYSVLITIYTIALISVMLGYVFTMAWNFSMPVLFELPVLTYWQGMAIIFMSRILTNSSVIIKTESNNEQAN